MNELDSKITSKVQELHNREGEVERGRKRFELYKKAMEEYLVQLQPAPDGKSEEDYTEEHKDKVNDKLTGMSLKLKYKKKPTATFEQENQVSTAKFMTASESEERSFPLTSLPLNTDISLNKKSAESSLGSFYGGTGSAVSRQQSPSEDSKQ